MSHRHYAERKEAFGHSSMGVYLIFTALYFYSRSNTHGYSYLCAGIRKPVKMIVMDPKIFLANYFEAFGPSATLPFVFWYSDSPAGSTERATHGERPPSVIFDLLLTVSGGKNISTCRFHRGLLLLLKYKRYKIYSQCPYEPI